MATCRWTSKQTAGPRKFRDAQSVRIKIEQNETLNTGTVNRGGSGQTGVETGETICLCLFLWKTRNDQRRTGRGVRGVRLTSLASDSKS